MMLKAILVTSLCFFSFFEVKAADAQDIYIEGSGLFVFEKNTYFGDFSVGYLPWDDWGLALNFQQGGLATTLAAELRWFNEPFEFSAGAGSMFYEDSLLKTTSLFFFLNANYLVALSPSLAAFLNMKGIFASDLFQNASAGLGLRVLF